NKIEREHDNFQRYVKRFLCGGRHTAVQYLRYSPRLGGIVYSLLGFCNEQFIDFSYFYHSTSDFSEITNVLDHFFQDTFANWNDNRSSIWLRDLAAYYQSLFDFSSKSLEDILASKLKSVVGGKTLTFSSLHTTQEFTNPLLAIAGLSFPCCTSTCITHGDF